MQCSVILSIICIYVLNKIYFKCYMVTSMHAVFPIVDYCQDRLGKAHCLRLSFACYFNEN